MRKKKKNLSFLIALVLTGVFVIAAVMFALEQYKTKTLFSWAGVDGFTISFKVAEYNNGKTLYFGLIFIFSILGALISCMGAFYKKNIKLFFAFCAAFALGSIIVYLIYYFSTVSRTKNLSAIFEMKWTFAFWFGFVLQIIALLGSGFGALKEKQAGKHFV